MDTPKCAYEPPNVPDGPRPAGPGRPAGRARRRCPDPRRLGGGHEGHLRVAVAPLPELVRGARRRPARGRAGAGGRLPRRAGGDPEARDRADLGGGDLGRIPRRRPGGPDEDATGRRHAARHRAPARGRARGCAAPGRRSGLRHRARAAAAIVALAFCAGLRRSEIASLVWDDIKPTARAGQLRVRVRTSKANVAGRPGPRVPEPELAEAFEAERGGEDLDAAVDLVRAEGDDAVGRVRGCRRTQLVDSAGERAGEQPEVLAAAVGVRLRGPHADPQLRPDAARRRNLMRVGWVVTCEGRWAALVTGGAKPHRGEVFRLYMRSRREWRTVVVTDVLAGRPGYWRVRKRFLGPGRRRAADVRRRRRRGVADSFSSECSALE